MTTPTEQREAQRARFLQADNGAPDAELHDGDLGDGVGQLLHQEVLGLLDVVDDALGQGLVVDGVVDVVGAASLAHIGVERQIDDDILLFDALLGIDPDDAAQQQVVDLNLVSGHGGYLSRSGKKVVGTNVYQLA